MSFILFLILSISPTFLALRGVAAPTLREDQGVSQRFYSVLVVKNTVRSGRVATLFMPAM